MAETTLCVRLLSHTPDPEETVVMAARICYAGCDIAALAQKVAHSDVRKFIERLLSMGHMSPMEHASFTFGVEGVSRALLAQLTRHRIASFSVQSQRYVELGGEEGFGYVVPPAIAALGDDARQKYQGQMHTLQQWYDEWRGALGGGKTALEDARFVLPNACATTLMMTMNARELMHFFTLRCCMRAQWEIRQLAWAMLGCCLRVAPNLFASAGPACVHGGCAEGDMSCGMAKGVHTLRHELGKLAPDAGDGELVKWACEEAGSRE